MKFAQPLWLLAGLIACAALVWRYRRFDARQRTELAKFASASLIAQLTASVSPARRQFKRALVVAGVACVAVALARPLIGFRWEEAKRKGLDVMFAVDTSKSMLAQDVKPDRLTRAKMAVEDLLTKMDGDRVGLVAFAGNSFLQCPLTLDYDAFRQSLDALDVNIIPRGGTDIAAAIHETEAALEGNGNNERILVLLTDGEDLEGNALEAARAAAKNGLKIFTVGVGSANGELIPVLDDSGGTQFAKDASGQFVKSRLDETMLKQIAEATGGMYQPLGQQAQGLDTIYSQGLAKFTRHELASRMQKVYIERFQWPLALGLLLLVLEPLLGIRRNKRVTKPAVTTPPGLAASWNRMARPATAVAAVALLTVAGAAHASVGSAEKAFQKGNYVKAEQDYRQAATRNPNKPELHKQLLRLTRDVQVSNETYTGLLNQAQQLDIARAGTVGNVRIIDTAAVDTTHPVKPKKAVIALGGTFLGGFLAVAFVFLRQMLNRGVEDPAAIEQLGLPVYASIPRSEQESTISVHGKRVHADGRQHLLAVSAPADLATEALRSLRTSLHFARLEAKNNVLMISGSSPNAGKTFVSANLAAVIAQGGQRVLLIDGDMRMGMSHKVVGGRAEQGLSELISGQIDLAAATRPVAGIEGLHFIARGKTPPNPSELLMHARFTTLLEQLKPLYDLIIIDTPPILAVTDAAVIGHHAGTSLLVVRFGLNQAREIALAKQRFEQNGVEIKGAIFNAVEKRSSGYYSYGYYQYGDAKAS